MSGAQVAVDPIKWAKDRYAEARAGFNDLRGDQSYKEALAIINGDTRNPAGKYLRNNTQEGGDLLDRGERVTQLVIGEKILAQATDKQLRDLTDLTHQRIGLAGKNVDAALKEIAEIKKLGEKNPSILRNNKDLYSKLFEAEKNLNEQRLLLVQAGKDSKGFAAQNDYKHAALAEVGFYANSGNTVEGLLKDTPPLKKLLEEVRTSLTNGNKSISGKVQAEIVARVSLPREINLALRADPEEFSNGDTAIKINGKPAPQIPQDVLQANVASIAVPAMDIALGAAVASGLLIPLVSPEIAHWLQQRASSKLFTKPLALPRPGIQTSNVDIAYFNEMTEEGDTDNLQGLPPPQSVDTTPGVNRFPPPPKEKPPNPVVQAAKAGAKWVRENPKTAAKVAVGGAVLFAGKKIIEHETEESKKREDALKEEFKKFFKSLDDNSKMPSLPGEASSPEHIVNEAKRLRELVNGLSKEDIEQVIKARNKLIKDLYIDENNPNKLDVTETLRDEISLLKRKTRNASR